MDQGAGACLIVHLNAQQWQAVAARIPVEWKEAMREHRVQTYGKAHNYDLPAICWRRIFDLLSAKATGPLGGNTQGPEALYGAIQKMIRLIMQAEQHPALVPGRSVTGWRSEVIPAWQDPVSAHRSPYPHDGWTFVLLRPRHFVEREWSLTMWESTPDDDLLVAESRTHCEQLEAVFHAQISPVGVDLRGVPQD